MSQRISGNLCLCFLQEEELGGFFHPINARNSHDVYLGQECSHTARARAPSQQGGDNRAECCSTLTLSQHAGDGSKPHRAGYSSQGAQVSATKFVLGEFSGNSGLCA